MSEVYGYTHALIAKDGVKGFGTAVFQTGCLNLGFIWNKKPEVHPCTKKQLSFT